MVPQTDQLTNLLVSLGGWGRVYAQSEARVNRLGTGKIASTKKQKSLIFNF